MRVNDNGIYRDMTDEEIEQMQSQTVEPTQEELKAEFNQKYAELMALAERINNE